MNSAGTVRLGKNEKMHSVNEVAAIFNISSDSVRRMIRGGVISHGGRLNPTEGGEFTSDSREGSTGGVPHVSRPGIWANKRPWAGILIHRERIKNGYCNCSSIEFFYRNL